MVCVRGQVRAVVGAFGIALSWATSLHRLGAATDDVPATWLDPVLVTVVLLCAVYALAPRQLRLWERWEYPFDMPIAEAIRRVIATTPDHSWATEAAADTHVFVKVLHRKMCEGDLSVAGSCREFEKPSPISKARCRSLTPSVGLAPGWLHVRSADLYRL